jgi:hypothetical protein
MPDVLNPAPDVATAVRSLLVAGYDLDDSGERHPSHIEIRCAKPSVFGVEVRFLIAVTDMDEFSDPELEDIRRAAKQELRVPVFVGNESTDSQLGWSEFLSDLGGSVPSWRAISTSYAGTLAVASQNTLSPGMSGEAWLVFEDLVCDGLEFIFGRRAKRMGGRRRGQKVSDITAVLPTSELLVVDAKAAANGFEANWPAFRPLVEYTKKQQQRQQGYNIVHSALVVSSSFCQKAEIQQQLSNSFLAETRVPLTFMTVPMLTDIISRIQTSVDLRTAINWKRIFSGGSVTHNAFSREFTAASSETIRVSEY